eukprot:1159406-Pelagomonas_calceolata.AAC.14
MVALPLAEGLLLLFHAMHHKMKIQTLMLPGKSTGSLDQGSLLQERRNVAFRLVLSNKGSFSLTKAACQVTKHAAVAPQLCAKVCVALAVYRQLEQQSHPVWVVSAC